MSSEHAPVAERTELADPPAGALVEALRGLGYSLPTALADLIDNSISAHASRVWVDFAWAGGRSCITVLDDGQGMDEATLKQAMRPGSRNPLEQRSADDLGRFGLGLKTASFSQCRRLTVASKARGGAVAVRRWDLDHIVRKDRWELLLDPATGSEGYIARLDEVASGTLVLWEVLDRIVPDVDNRDPAARSRFLQLAHDVERHLAMVFHRYLAGSLRLWMNGRDDSALIHPWDPFLTAHGATSRLPNEPLMLGNSRVDVQGFVLPHKDRLTEDEFVAASGPAGWGAHQGFFVYRNRRLLVPGGWLGLGEPRAWPREEQYKLARIRVDIPNSSDHEWKIDVRKSTARPPDALRRRLRDVADRVRNDARRVFVHRGRPTGSGPGAIPSRPWKQVEVSGRLAYRIDRNHPLVKSVLEGIGAGRARVVALLRVLEETVPVQQIWLDVAERPELHAQSFTGTDPEMLAAMRLTYNALLAGGAMTPRQARDRLYLLDPFHERPHLIESLDNT